MGFLPTLDGNIRLSLNEWLQDGTFWTLRARLAKEGSGNALADATKFLEPELKRTMQLRPSPELIWRMPKREVPIGTETVTPNDLVVLSIVSATQQCLQSGTIDEKPDVYPIFGGERDPKKPHPTHACPGYKAAMGALLGFMSALLEIKESMQPGAAPLVVTLEGELPPNTIRSKPLGWRARLGQQLMGTEPEGAQPAGEPRILLADGDSWMSYASWGPIGRRQNIADYLAQYHDFDVENIAFIGTRLYSFFDNGEDTGNPNWTPAPNPQAKSDRLERLVAKVKDLIRRGRAPNAILFSAGGTDVVEARLLRLLKKGAAERQELDMDWVKKQVDLWMADWLTKVLTAINSRCQVKGVPIPVFIHGYAYPVPDGRWLNGVSWTRCWLWRFFHQLGYEASPTPAYPRRGAWVMEQLIGKLNAMQKEVAKNLAPHVFHVDLTGGILSKAPGTYVQDWDNELHPTERGFKLLAQKFADDLNVRLKLTPSAQRLAQGTTASP